jgi:hypothetical protein
MYGIKSPLFHTSSWHDAQARHIATLLLKYYTYKRILMKGAFRRSVINTLPEIHHGSVCDKREAPR